VSRIQSRFDDYVDDEHLFAAAFFQKILLVVTPYMDVLYYLSTTRDLSTQKIIKINIIIYQEKSKILIMKKRKKSLK
jgi:hypothetical protein